MATSTVVVLACSDDTPITAWDLDTGAQLAAFKTAGGGNGSGGGANACAGSAGLCAVGRGYLCAAQRHKDSVHLWAWHRDQPAHRCFAPERLTAVAASPDGALVAGGGASGALYLWLAATGALLRGWPAHYRPVSCLAFADGGAVLVSGGDDALALCWSVADAVDALPDAVAAGAAAAAGKGGAAGAGATAGAGARQQQQRPPANGPSSSAPAAFAHPRLEPMHTWSGHTLSVQSLHCGGAAATCGGGAAVVATASADRTVRLWSLSTGRTLLCLPVPGGAAATAVCLDPGEHSVFVGCADGAVYEASLLGGGGGGGAADEAAAAGSGGAAAAAAAAATAAAASGGSAPNGGASTAPNSSANPQFRRLLGGGGGHTRAVVSLAVAPCGGGGGGGDRLVSASEDGTARVWDLRTGQCVRTLASPARAPIAAALALPTPPALLRAGGGAGGGLLREAPRRAQPLAPLAKFASSSAAGGGGGGGAEAVPLILDDLAASAARRDPMLADELAAAASGGGAGTAAAALYAGVEALI